MARAVRELPCHLLTDLLLSHLRRGGPDVREPGQKGLGPTLLQRVLAAYATVETDFRPEGLRFRMVAPFIEQRHVPVY
jgi:two-component sensor histidine kinase